MSDSPLQLLQVCDLAKQWPNLKALHDLAMQDLAKANVDAQTELDKRAKAAADAAAKVAAEAKAKADAAAEAEKKASTDE